MRFIVSGSSMEPTYSPGDTLFVSRILHKLFPPKVGDVVVAKDPRDGRLLLKRIKRITQGLVTLKGDNPAKSTDSRHFGHLPRKSIIGKVLFRYR